jgi:hypothetical protein
VSRQDTGPLPAIGRTTQRALGIWQVRARAVGLTQVTISAFVGKSEAYVSKTNRAAHPPEAIRAIITAWELFPPPSRVDWKDAMQFRRKTRWNRQPVTLMRAIA